MDKNSRIEFIQDLTLFDCKRERSKLNTSEPLQVVPCIKEWLKFKNHVTILSRRQFYYNVQVILLYHFPTLGDSLVIFIWFKPIPAKYDCLQLAFSFHYIVCLWHIKSHEQDKKQELFLHVNPLSMFCHRKYGYMDIIEFPKKGHNSRTLVSDLTQCKSSTSTCHRDQVKQFNS